jgi:hypothetical protein
MPYAIVIRPARPAALVPAGTSSTADGQEPSMPDLWDTNRDQVFSTPEAQPTRLPAIPTTTPRRSGSRMPAADSGSPPTC